MNMLGVYGSPREGSNTQILLDIVLKAAEESGARVQRLYLRRMIFDSCTACGACAKTGVCILRDEMTEAYPLIEACQVMVLAFPIHFYGPPALAKAFIDRAQALFCGRALKKLKEEWGAHEGGSGYLLSVGATRGEMLFAPSELMVKYFYDALDMDYGGGMFFRNLDALAAVKGHPEHLQAVADWGAHLAKNR